MTANTLQPHLLHSDPQERRQSLRTQAAVHARWSAGGHTAKQGWLEGLSVHGGLLRPAHGRASLLSEGAVLRLWVWQPVQKLWHNRVANIVRVAYGHQGEFVGFAIAFHQPWLAQASQTAHLHAPWLQQSLA